MKKDKFKPHKMYCKDGSVHNANTFAKHMKLKNRGRGHRPMKKNAKK